MSIHFRGIDNTFGSSILEQVAEDRYDKMNDEDKFNEFKIFELFKKHYNTDAILSLLCQYDNRNKLNMHDASWLSNYSKMITEGTLYMTLFKTKSWAYSDYRENDNYSILQELGFNVTNKNKRNSDGLWSYDGEIELKKVYANDEITEQVASNDGLESIIIDNPHGVVEFGTTKLCKSVMSICNNDILLRVPYQLDGYDFPVCALFFNTKQPTFEF
jgi:hypothetical protein